jgi:hypothetical protein
VKESEGESLIAVVFSGFLEFGGFLTIFSVGLFETKVYQRDHSMTFIDKFSIFPV